MQQTIIDLHVSLPKADASVAATVTQPVRAAGFFGYRSIDVTAPDSVQLGLLAHVDYSAADAVLSLPLLSAGGIDAGTSSAVTRVRELDAHLTELAERIGYPCYFYEAQTDWELLVDGTGIDHDGQDLAGVGPAYPVRRSSALVGSDEKTTCRPSRKSRCHSSGGTPSAADWPMLAAASQSSLP